MKNIIIILVLCLFPLCLPAQTPEKMTYQAVLRDNNNSLIVNRDITIQVNILHNSPEENSLYLEYHYTVTNANGLINIEIGSGENKIGSIADINWADGTYYIKTDIDPEAGNNFTITAVSQVLSVPYALHAKTAENASVCDYNNLTNKPVTDGSETKITAGTNISITGNGTGADPYVVNASNNTTQHYLGEYYNGGIIFNLYTGSDGLQHGLIASLTESSSAIYSSTNSWVYATKYEDGAYNTTRMINSTAKTWVTNLGTGWYIPSFEELILLYSNRYYVSKGVVAHGSGVYMNGFATFWSSTESSSTNAIAIDFLTGNTISVSKSSSYFVRAIKAF